MNKLQQIEQELQTTLSSIKEYKNSEYLELQKKGELNELVEASRYIHLGMVKVARLSENQTRYGGQ